MAADELATRALDADEVKRSWSQLLKIVARREERILVEADGTPVAALVSPQDLQRLQHLDAQRAERFKILDRIGAAFADEDPDESERLAALAVAEAREQAHRERADQRKA